MKNCVTLVVDTSTEACTVAVAVFNHVAERFWQGKRQHAEKVLPMVQDALGELSVSISDIEVIGVTRGPGSFTGVRLGVCVAQGLAIATGADLHAVSTLAVIAQVAADKYRRDHVVAAIDARMGEVYAGAFVRGPDGRMVAVSAEVICPPERLRETLGELPSRSWCGAGSGWQYEDCLRPQFVHLEQVDAAILPSAMALMLQIEGVRLRESPLDPADLQPAYLRNDVADPAARVTPSFDLNTFLSSF